MKYVYGLLLCTFFACQQRGARPMLPQSLLTTADRTDYQDTGRYEEVALLCHEYARQYSAQVRCVSLGTSPEGRELWTLIVSRDGKLTPAAAQADSRPVVLVQAGIHAGEIDGKDAGFWFLREQLATGLPLVDRATVVFFPIYNVDGHERFGPNHRPNQRGPREMGWRTTSQNLNLNRDYVKADAPETQAWLKSYLEWQPTVFVDLHATNGAKFQHDIAVMVHPCFGRDDDLGRAACALSDSMMKRLAAAGHMPLPFYPAFDEDNNPASGFSLGDPPPRFSHHYAAETGRLGVLVETHSWRPYKERVLSTKHALEALFAEVSLHADQWRAATKAVELPPSNREVTLLATSTSKSRTIDFLGYAYDRVPSEISQGLWTRYDETKPVIWQVPMRDEATSGLVVRAPGAGYWVPQAMISELAPRIKLHGIVSETWDPRWLARKSQAFVVSSARFGASYEGRSRPALAGAWQQRPDSAETARLGPGLWIPFHQPRWRLVLHLLEPSAPDSFAAWGFFNAFLERKEYMESYVTEEFAREMLRDPAVAAAFAEWTADPRNTTADARLLFFEMRHPSWDQRYNVLPIVKVDARDQTHEAQLTSAARP